MYIRKRLGNAGPETQSEFNFFEQIFHNANWMTVPRDERARRDGDEDVVGQGRDRESGRLRIRTYSYL